MKTIKYKNARLINGDLCDILIRDTIIEAIADQIKTDANEVIDMHGAYVSAGWIDLHTHCFSKYELYGDDIDTVGYHSGVTTVCDAGTAGSDTIEEFYKQAQHAKTRVLSFINIAKQGIKAQDELSNLDNIDAKAIQHAYETYPDFIVGLKARMSHSVLQNSGNTPLDMAVQIANELQLPIMVHIGNAPASLADIFARVRKGDIITHIFNPKQNGILDAQDTVKVFVKEGHERGIFFDVGHGSESFSFHTARCAKAQGLLCDSISTDIYYRNREQGPVYSLALTMSKMMHLGYSLETIVECVTSAPAKVLRQSHIGSLAPGYEADITFFNIVEKEVDARDANDERMLLQQILEPIAVSIKGEYIPLRGK